MGPGRRKRSIDEKNVSRKVAQHNTLLKRITEPSKLIETMEQVPRLFKEEFDSKGSFSGHGYGHGYEEGCTYCAKIVWIGVAALAIQAVMMQQGGGKKKRKRRNTTDVIDLDYMKFFNDDFTSDTLTKTKDAVMKVVGNSYGSLTKPRKMYSGKFMHSIL